jgi:hypothetical protein
MFGLDWWILLIATVLFNCIWPPITLLAGYWWARKGLIYAQEKANASALKVESAVSTYDAKYSSLIAQQKQEIIAYFDKRLDTAQKEIIDYIPEFDFPPYEELEAKLTAHLQASIDGKMGYYFKTLQEEVSGRIKAGIEELGGGGALTVQDVVAGLMDKFMGNRR